GAAPRDCPARRRASSARGLVVLLSERVPDGRAVARAGHPRPPQGVAGPRGSGRAGLPGRVRRRSSGDPLGPRPRGRGVGRRPGTRLPEDRDAERRSRVRAGARRSGATGARGTLGSVIQPGEIAAEHASRHFKVYPREARRLKDVVVARRRSQPAEVRALRDVSFHVEPGSAIGLVGRNGSGKTTLLRLLSGIIKPTSGRVDVGGRVGSLLELGAGFHPDLTGR